MDIDRLTTPALILERAVVARNTKRMGQRMAAHGVALRPHMKTAKSAEVAALAVSGQAGGITVSTLAEAAYFLERGFRDIVYAVGIVSGKLPIVADLMARGADLKILTDNLDAVQAIAAFEGPGIFKVLIEIDCGDARTGLPCESPELIAVARAIDGAANAELCGVLTHGGHSYLAKDIEGIKQAAREEREAVVGAAERLRGAGLPCPIVSAGSTPTAVHGESYAGLTEMRPGVFVFFDIDQLAREVCGREDLALSVLASVIGHNRHVGQIILDAGALALSKDISANARWPQTGYGALCDPNSMAPLPGLHVAKVSQEHGIVPVGDVALYDALPIGAKVRILPNHACITAAGYSRYHVVEGTQIVDEWDRVNGW